MQEPLARAFYSGLEIITIVQLFNWFAKKHNGVTLLMIKLVQPLAFWMQFSIGGYLQCFPNMPYYLSPPYPEPVSTCGKYFNNGFAAASMNRHLIFGFLMGVLMVIEWFTFHNLPLERALILEDNDRKRT